MDTIPQTPAPAPSPDPILAPAPDTAAHAAIQTRDFRQFREAKMAEAAGKPLPVPEALDDAPVAEGHTASSQPPTERTLSKRQQNLNEQIRQSVERAVAEKDAEIARLRAERTTPPVEASKPAVAAPVAAADPEPNHEDADKYPGGEYDPKFLRDVAAWSGREAVRQAEVQTRAAASERELFEAQQQRASMFVDRITRAKTADPEFLNKLTPEVKAIGGFQTVKPGETPGPINVIGEEVYDSPIVDKVLLHFSTHPEDLKRMTAMPDHIAKMPRQLQVKAHITWIIREFGRLEERLGGVTAAPAIPETIESAAPEPASSRVGQRVTTPGDPSHTAIKQRDFRKFRLAQRAKLEASRGR